MNQIIELKSKDNTMMQVEYNVVRSNRKTCSIAVNENSILTVRIPLHVRSEDVEMLLQGRQFWITDKLLKLKERQNIKSAGSLTQAQQMALSQRYIDAAREYITKRAAYYLAAYPEIIKKDYSRIQIRDQKTRWGSCSSKGTLSFNWRLMLAPPPILDYVIVHELCHLTYMNHSKEFWRCVASILPDYKEKRNWLKEHGNELTLS